MTDYRSMHPPDRLHYGLHDLIAVDAKQITARIETISGGDIEHRGEGKRSRTCMIAFKCVHKSWPCNKTNCRIIARMFGDDVESWIGKWITIGVVRCAVNAKFSPEGLRVEVIGSPDIDADITMIKRSGGQKIGESVIKKIVRPPLTPQTKEQI